MLTRTGRTSPIILGRIDCAGAHSGTVECTNVPHSNAASQQRVQMHVHFGRSIDRYVDILVADYVLGNDGATNRGTAIAAIDIDAHTAGGRGVGIVGEISGNRIKDDFVPTHVVGG